MRLDIRYVTRFAYESVVSESQNELRACPAADAHQQLVHYHVTTTPSSRVASYVDYWGTRVDTFGIRAPHRELEVVAEATVETLPREVPTERIPIAEVHDDEFADPLREYLLPSPHVTWGSEVAARARAIAAGAGDHLVELVQAVHDDVAGLTYEPGSTYVGVSVDEVVRGGSGVCQDFAHVSLAVYRELGVPARYVSGYLFAVDDATGRHDGVDEVSVQTHAWVEVAVPRHGWVALDPTNSQPVGERHVAIGRGRDYDDVAPFRGVFRGPDRHRLDVGVTMRRLAVEPTGDASVAVPPRSAQAVQ